MKPLSKMQEAKVKSAIRAYANARAPFAMSITDSAVDRIYQYNAELTARFKFIGKEEKAGYAWVERYLAECGSTGIYASTEAGADRGGERADRGTGEGERECGTPAPEGDNGAEGQGGAEGQEDADDGPEGAGAGEGEGEAEGEAEGEGQGQDEEGESEGDEQSEGTGESTGEGEEVPEDDEPEISDEELGIPPEPPADMTGMVQYIAGTTARDVAHKVAQHDARKIVREELKKAKPSSRTVHEFRTPLGVGEVEGDNLNAQFPEIVKAVSLGYPVYLYGPAGTGKSYLCKQVAKALGLDFYSSNAVTQEHKITGWNTADGTYVPSQFYRAFKYGGLFMLDEMDASIPEVLIILNQAIANGETEFPEGNVKAHPNFRVMGTSNTVGRGADDLYNARSQLDVATLDRFVFFNIDYDPKIEMLMARGDKDVVNFVRGLRKLATANGISAVFTMRAEDMLSGLASGCKNKEMDAFVEGCVVKYLSATDMDAINEGFRASPIADNPYVKSFKRVTARVKAREGASESGEVDWSDML